jgi:hypothetical protein
MPHQTTVIHRSVQCFRILIDLELELPILASLSYELSMLNRQFLRSVVGANLQVVYFGDVNFVYCRRLRDLFKVISGNMLFLMPIRVISLCRF